MNIGDPSRSGRSSNVWRQFPKVAITSSRSIDGFATERRQVPLQPKLVIRMPPTPNSIHPLTTLPSCNHCHRLAPPKCQSAPSSASAAGPQFGSPGGERPWNDLTRPLRPWLPEAGLPPTSTPRPPTAPPGAALGTTWRPPTTPPRYGGPVLRPPPLPRSLCEDAPLLRGPWPLSNRRSTPTATKARNSTQLETTSARPKAGRSSLAAPSSDYGAAPNPAAP